MIICTSRRLMAANKNNLERYRSGHNEAVLKTVWRKPHGFESHPLRHTCGGQFACRSFFIYISPDNIDFAAKNTPAVGNSPAAVFFIYISPDNIDFAAKNAPAVGNLPAAVFLFISHSTILISQQKTHLRWAIEFHNLYTDST